MKKNLLLALLLFICASDVGAQTLEWAKRMGGTGSEYGNSIAVDGTGNVYTTGYFSGTADFDPGAGTFYLTAADTADIFVSKLDASGNFVWAKKLGGTGEDYGYSITVDVTGNVYTTGCFSGTADFDPGAGTFNLTSAGSTDIFISKLDASGNFVWAKNLGGLNYEYGLSIAVDGTGNVYTTGRFWGTTDFDPGSGTFNLTSAGVWDIFISKLDASGNFVWAKNPGGTDYDYGYSIAVDGTGNVYTTGCFSGTADFDPGTGILTLTSAGDEDIFISKLDASGNFVWAKKIGGPDYDNGCSIAVDGTGNVFTTGFFGGTADFDPGAGTFNLTEAGGYYYDIFISKLDASGNFVWAKNLGGTSYDEGLSIAVDGTGNVFTTGYFDGTADFDPGAGTFNLTSAVGSWDVFISKLNASGNFVWAKNLGGQENDIGYSIAVDGTGNVYTTGLFGGTADFDPGAGTFNLTAAGWWYDTFILKLKQKGATGFVYNDINQNCVRDSNEIGLQNRFVTFNPGNIIAQTNEAGVWDIDSIPVGTYTATIDTSGHWTATCPVSQPFTVINPNEITYVPDFGLASTQPCASPEVSVNMPFMRPCFSYQLVYVNACNQYLATGVFDSAYIDVELDSMIIPDSASIAYTSLGNNTYRFQIGNLNPGQCVNFTINCTVSCYADLGQTLCMHANIYPADSCVFDTIPDPYPGGVTPCTLPWDHSSLQVEGYCENDTIYFVVYNTGGNPNGNMQCWAPVRVFVDGVYTLLDSVLITGGDSVVFAFAGDGHTWRLEADQHPLHPGNSHPNATVELCGDSANWTPGNVTILPQNDSDPVVDIYCGVVTGSYDPNDKTGYPTGVTSEHFVYPNQQIQYVIRFQNTGTDTAFTVIVRDTLDTDLDIFSVAPGVASHDYHFYMHGPRVLEWTFYNIMLPDSNVNEPASNGFLTFTVEQNTDLPNGTVINNEADIYFDFNAPVITNQTMHTVNEDMQHIAPVNTVTSEKNSFRLFPNPAENVVYAETGKLNKGAKLEIFNMSGYRMYSLPVTSGITTIDLSSLPKGVYVVKSVDNGGVAVAKLVVR